MLFSTDLRLSIDGLYTVGCPSNDRRASSISVFPAPAAQTSVGGTACSLLLTAGYAAMQASPPDHTPIAGLAIPLLTHTCCYSPATADEPVNPRTPLCLRLDRRIFHGSCSFRPRPRRRPPPCGLGSLIVYGAPPSCVVNVVNNREEQGDDCTWRG